MTSAIKAIANDYFRRLDRGPQARVERPCLNDKPLIVERRSLRSALRAPVETTESANCGNYLRASIARREPLADVLGLLGLVDGVFGLDNPV